MAGPEGLRPVNQHGLTHLSFQVEAAEPLLEEIVRCGGRVLESTRIEPASGTVAIFCHDPDGTLIELVQRAES